MKVKEHVRHSKGRPVTLPRHGGVQARRWRQRVAQSAVKPPARPLRTLTFPLDIELPPDLFPLADRLYNTVEGTGAGSLFRLLMRVHLAGVGLFQGVKEADAARNAAAFPDAAFQQAMRQDLGVDLTKLTPRHLFNLFKTVPKRTLVFDQATVANRIHAHCTGKSMDDRTPPQLRQVVETIAQTVLASVRGYQALATDAATVLEQVGRDLRRICPTVPSLAIAMPAQTAAGVPLAYTGTVDPVIDGEGSDYWLHHVIACLLRENPGAKPGEVQNLLLSFSNNALSNLFGVALFSSDGEAGVLRSCSLAQLMALLGIPASREESAKALLEELNAVPAPGLFRENHYAAYRPAVGGKLRSWVANYLNRLDTLQTQIGALADTALPEGEPMFVCQVLDGLGFSMSELRGMMSARAEAIAASNECLEVLSGRNRSMRPIACAQRLEEQLQLVRDIHGHFRAVANQLHQKLEAEDDADLRRWHSALSVADQDIFVLPRITGGNEATESTLAGINAQLHALIRQMRALHGLVVASGGGIDDVIRNLAADEKSRARLVPHRTLDEASARELAQRRLLATLARLATRLSTGSADRIWAWLAPVVTDASGSQANARKMFNRLRYNQQGRIYVSPWSPARHQPLPVNLDLVDDTDWLEMVAGLVSGLEKRLAATPDASALQDYLEALRCETQMRIDSIRKDIPVEDVRKAIDVEGLGVHYRLKSALSGKVVGRQALSSILALLGSHLSKMRFVARRQKFVVRQKFSRVGQDDLLYVPKQRMWAMPEKYRAAKGIIGQLLRTDVPLPAGEPVNVVEAFDIAAAKAPDTGIGHLLKQLPHDWYLPLDFRASVAPVMNGLPVGKDTVRRPEAVRKRVTSQAARLVGPSVYLNQIAGMLTRATETKEWMVVLDWVHRSEVAFSDGMPSLVAALDSCRAKVAVPIEVLGDAVEKVELFDRVVAIDLGERQIGYAVFDLRSALSDPAPVVMTDPATGQPAHGTVRVPGVRRLINSVRSHRSRQSGNTKLRQTFDRRLEELRENVAADVIQRIEALCARFNAFPVLESSVVNFQTGSRQLDLVYGDVVRHFTFSEVDAHKSMRTEHWMGADRWEHPYLVERRFDAASNKRTGSAKPLSLFPGAAVNPSGTSQVCNACRRNAIAALKSLGDGQIEVHDGGLVRVPDGDLRVLRGWMYSDEEFRLSRREKKNLAMNDPVRPGRYRAQEVMTALRRTMRQKNPFVMARDTTQSRFQCAYLDCGSTYHADQGAALNIGRKFFAERIDRDASLKKMRAS